MQLKPHRNPCPRPPRSDITVAVDHNNFYGHPSFADALRAAFKFMLNFGRGEPMAAGASFRGVALDNLGGFVVR